MREDERRDTDVIIDNFGLGKPTLGIEDLAEPGTLYVQTVYFEGDLGVDWMRRRSLATWSDLSRHSSIFGDCKSKKP
jgi:hypothetical protein